jgi:hypothetical protein
LNRSGCDHGRTGDRRTGSIARERKESSARHRRRRQAGAAAVSASRVNQQRPVPQKQRGPETFGFRPSCLLDVAPKPASHWHRAAATSALSDSLGFLDCRFVIPAAAKRGRRHARCRSVDRGIGVVAAAVGGLTTPRRKLVNPGRLLGKILLRKIPGHWSSHFLECVFLEALDNRCNRFCTRLARDATINAPNAKITCSFPHAYSFGNFHDESLAAALPRCRITHCELGRPPLRRDP